MFDSNMYLPGLHVLGTLYTSQTHLLTDYSDFKTWLEEQIEQSGLHALGGFYHAFDGAGYTGVVCLTESHIAFHTWPEHGLLTLDIFLSNYQKQNDDKARTLFNACAEYFSSHKTEQTEVKR